MPVAWCCVCSKVCVTPLRPFKSHFNQELKLISEYGLWRNMRSGGSTLLCPRAATERLYLKATPRCRCCTRWLPGSENQGFFGEVFKLALAKCIHHAWVLICQHHIRVCKQVVNMSPLLSARTPRRTSVFSLFSPYREASQRGRNAKKGQGGAGAGNNEQV